MALWLLFTVTKDKCPKKKMWLTDKNGCILILHTEVNDSECILINLYDSNP